MKGMSAFTVMVFCFVNVLIHRLYACEEIENKREREREREREMCVCAELWFGTYTYTIKGETRSNNSRDIKLGIENFG